MLERREKKGWFGISEALRYAVYQAMGSIRIWPLLGSDNQQAWQKENLDQLHTTFPSNENHHQ